MYLRHLRYLQLVIAKGSFDAAARAAGISQPAITQAMKLLERELQVTLFEKVGRRKVPTRMALLAAQRAGDIHSHMASLTRPPAESAVWQNVTAALRTGMAPAAALLYAPAVEAAWRGQFPDGVLQIASGSAAELLAALQDDELDLAIVPRPRLHRNAAGMRHHLLHTSVPTIYVRRGHPLAAATSLKEMVQASWAVAGRLGTAGNVIEEACRVRKLPEPHIAVQCNDYLTLLNLVAQSDLLCVVPHPVLLSHSTHAGVQPLRILEGLPKYEVCVFWMSPEKARNAASVQPVIQGLMTLVPAAMNT